MSPTPARLARSYTRDMPPARPLRDVFAGLSGTGDGSGADARSPDALLAEAGHPQLPAGLVAEAVVSYADTAPIEVAEHLAPYVMAHSAVPTDLVEDVDQPSWHEMLSGAPDPAGIGHLPPDDDQPGTGIAGETPHSWFGSGATHDGVDLDFGQGATGTDAAAGPDHGMHAAHPAALGDGPGGGHHGQAYHGDQHVLDVLTPFDDPPPHGDQAHHGYLEDGHVHDSQPHHDHGDTDAAGVDHHDLTGGHEGL
jgi:hypothetical protein